MRLRAQLVLAFFLLAVVPLLGLSVYSYRSSLRAFRLAVEAEAGALAEDMGTRIEVVTGDLSRRLESVGQMPLPESPGEAPEAEQARFRERLEATLGEAAEWVDAFVFVPEEPPTPPQAVEAPSPPPPPNAEGVPPLPSPEGMGSHRRGRSGWRFRLRDRPSPSDPSPGDAERNAKKARRAEAHAQRWEAAGRELEQKAAALGKELERRWGSPPPGSPADEKAKAPVRDAARAVAEMALLAAGEATQQLIDEGHVRAKGLLGGDYAIKLKRDGTQIGTVQAEVRSRHILDSVLARTGRRQGEIPFALDAENKLYTANPADAARIQALGLANGTGGAGTPASDWIVVKRQDAGSGLTLGIARPVGESLQEIRRTAARNLALGLGLVSLALLGILPLSRRMTERLGALSAGAERLAKGDLDARVPVGSRDEFGRLAETFNRMASDLRGHQDHLLEQARLRKELEMCRRIQEDLLPKDPLRLALAEARGLSIPAREVGGDFFNYFVLPEGEVALLVGDVAGKGVPAALLMANLQATLRARLPLEKDLAVLARQLDEEIEATTPAAAYLTLFAAVIHRGELRYVNAGHNTQFLLHVNGGLTPLESTGRPLGLLPGGGYEQRVLAIAPGDSLFLFTDGLVDAENEAGEPFGAERLQGMLIRERAANLDDLLAHVEGAVREHRGRAEPSDDATLLVLKVS